MLTELYLHYRQLNLLLRHNGEVPSAFASIMTIENHQKAIQYSCTKLRFSVIKLITQAVWLYFLFPARGLNAFYNMISFQGSTREIVFLFMLGSLQYLLNLPFKLYSTFVIEEKFGFNKTTLRLFWVDQLKAIILSFILMTPILFLLLWIITHVKYWWIFAATFLTCVQFGLVLIYPKFIAPLFNKFYPLNDEKLSHGIQTLVQKIGFQLEEIFVMDASKRSSHGNAYFTGLGKVKRIVFFDTLMKELTTGEVLAVLAHELGHMKLNHITKSLVTSTLFTYVGFFILSSLSHFEWFFRGHFVSSQSPGMLIFLMTTALPVYLFFIPPITSYLSRKKEFEADAFAAHHTSAKDLISALIKLYRSNSSPMIHDPYFSRYYHSHPPATERIAHLESYASQTLS